MLYIHLVKSPLKVGGKKKKIICQLQSSRTCLARLLPPVSLAAAGIDFWSLIENILYSKLSRRTNELFESQRERPSRPCTAPSGSPARVINDTKTRRQMLTSSCRNVSPLAASTWIATDRFRSVRSHKPGRNNMFSGLLHVSSKRSSALLWPRCFSLSFFLSFSFFKLPLAFQSSEPSFFFFPPSVTAAPEPSAASGGSGTANMLSPLGSSLLQQVLEELGGVGGSSSLFQRRTVA